MTGVEEQLLQPWTYKFEMRNWPTNASNSKMPTHVIRTQSGEEVFKMDGLRDSETATLINYFIDLHNHELHARETMEAFNEAAK